MEESGLGRRRHSKGSYSQSNDTPDPTPKAAQVSGSRPRILSHFCHKAGKKEKADVMCTFLHSILGF